MDRKAAKELLHIKGWLDRVDQIVARGKDAYLADDILQEAGGYPLAYLTFHGDRGVLFIGNSELNLADLAAVIGPGMAQDRILYFGSCSTMAAPAVELQTFCKSTGAKAIVGCTRPIDWLESAAFDCLLVPRLLNMTFMKPVFTSLEKEHPKFVRRLGLRIATAKWATERKIALEAVA